MIVDAAIALFGSSGWSGASMANLAERCAISKAVLYDCFPDGKEALFEEVLARCMDRCLEDLETIRPGAPLFAAALAQRVDEGRIPWSLVVLPFPDLPEPLVRLQRAHRRALLQAVARRGAVGEPSRRRRGQLGRRFAAVVVLTLFADHLEVEPDEVDAIVEVLLGGERMPAVC